MDRDLTGRTGDLLAGLALFRDASVPEPSPELTALFASTATAAATTTAAPALPTPRSTPLYKRILSGVPSKIAAAALGALLAGSLGAGAGALTGTLASSEDDTPAVEAPVVDDTAVDDDEHESDDEAAEVEDEAAEVEDEVAVDEVDDDGANDAAVDADLAADLAAVPVPTSVSEAAHTHDFDEVCGNHGRYVSFFARTGTEIECAVQARSAAGSEDESEPVADEPAAAELVADDTDAADDGSSVEPSKHDAKVTKSKASTGGSNWQLEADRTSAKGGKSNKGKGGR
jgi:hypothetical protein